MSCFNSSGHKGYDEKQYWWRWYDGWYKGYYNTITQKTMNAPNHSPENRKSKKPVIFFIIISVILLVALLNAWRSPAPFSAKNIDKDVQEILGKQPDIRLPIDVARDVQQAILRRDYTTANKMLSDMAAESKQKPWRFFPFVHIMSIVAACKDPAFEGRLTEWIGHDDKNGFPYLLRSEYFLNKAGNARGGGFMNSVSAANQTKFVEYLIKAHSDVQSSLKRNGITPYSYWLMLSILEINGNSPEMNAAFLQSIDKFPDYYPVYVIRLTSLNPKWGGSLDMMYDFVERYAGKAPKNSPLQLLYLELYSNVLDASAIGCFLPDENDQVKECIRQATERNLRPNLEDKVQNALNLYNQLDRHEFDMAVDSIFTEIVAKRGSFGSADKAVQQLADATGSDNEMMEKNPGHNNYVVDKMAAKLWIRDKFNENAEKKYLEALEDLKRDPFPEEAENIQERAYIYFDLADLYKSMANYPRAIAYDKAAIKLTHQMDVSSLRCDAYYNLRQYQTAIEECGKVYDNYKDPKALYVKAYSYDLLGKFDESIKDYTTLADSETNYKTDGAIGLTVEYAKRKDIKAELDVFSRYPYLLDERSQTRSSLAVAYNNRCYAYMELGQLQKALDDCNISLKFGNIPDAYQKRKTLLEKLKTQ